MRIVEIIFFAALGLEGKSMEFRLGNSTYYFVWWLIRLLLSRDNGLECRPLGRQHVFQTEVLHPPQNIADPRRQYHLFISP